MKKTIRLTEPWSGEKHNVNKVTLFIYIIITTLLIIYFRFTWARDNFNLFVFISTVIIYFFVARYFLFNKKMFHDFNLNNEVQMLTKEGVIFFAGVILVFVGLYFGDNHPQIMLIIFFISIVLTTLGVYLQNKKRPVNEFVLNNRKVMKFIWVLYFLLMLFIIYASVSGILV